MNINIARESKEGRVLLDVGDLMRSVHPSIRSAMELSLCYADRIKGIANNQDRAETDQFWISSLGLFVSAVANTDDYIILPNYYSASAYILIPQPLLLATCYDTATTWQQLSALRNFYDRMGQLRLGGHHFSV